MALLSGLVMGCGPSDESTIDPDRLIEKYDRTIARHPDDAEAYYRRGNAYYRKGDLDQAIADFDQALELDPQHAQAWYSRGLAHYDRGELDAAIADYDRSIALDPEFAVVYYQRGLAYDYRGEYEKAAADLRRALELGLPAALEQAAGDKLGAGEIGRVAQVCRFRLRGLESGRLKPLLRTWTAEAVTTSLDG